MAYQDTPRDGGGNKFSSGKPFVRGDRPYGKPAGDRPVGDRPYNRDAKPFESRPAPAGDRPARPAGGSFKPYGDRPAPRPYGDRPAGDRPAGNRPFDRDAKPYGDRPARPAGDRPFNRDAKPFGDRPVARPYGDRPAPRPYGDRPAGDRPGGDRPFNRDAKPFGDRPARPYGDRPAGDRPFNRDAKPYGDRPTPRPYGDRPTGDRPFNRDAKPYGDRPAPRPYGDRPAGDRPFNRDAKPYGDRPAARPYGDRPAARPYGDRPAPRPYGDRPAPRPYGDRPAGDRPAGDRSFNRDAKPYGKPYEKPVFNKFDRQEAYKPIEPVSPQPAVSTEEQDEDQLPLIIYGRNTVREAIKSGRSIDRILVISTGADDGSLREIVAMAREKNLVISQVEKAKLDALCLPFGHAGKTANHQGIIAQMPECEYATIEEILENAKAKNEPPFVLVLDSINDPHNLGSIIRSAECAGVHGVVIPKRRSASVTAAVAKASAGATMYVPVARVSNLTQTVQQLKEAGLWIAGADMDGKPMSEVALKGPLALVIGGEEEGISRLLKEKCDYIVAIPLAGSIASLNASVSAAVLMYEKRRQDGK